jgi:hypothetical protein
MAGWITPTGGLTVEAANAAYAPVSGSPNYAPITARLHAEVAAAGARPVMVDVYRDRPDRQIALGQSGEGTPTGQRYTSDGPISNNIAVVSGGLQTWTDETTSGATPVRILGTHLGVLPTVITKALIFTDGTSTHAHNHVLGCCKVGFSDVTGSIQCCIRGDNTWQAFFTDYNGPGATLQIVNFNAPAALPFTLVQDGVRVYFHREVWDPVTSSISVYLDGVPLGTVTDPRINAYWGDRVCSQYRRNNTTDGIIRVAAFAAGAP